MSDFGEELLSRKCEIEIKEVNTFSGKPYLILSVTEGSSIKVVSTVDVDFYREYSKAKKKFELQRCECDSNTGELLKFNLEEIYEKYNYPEEVYIEGKTSYFYDKLCRLMRDAEKLQEISLYSWKDENGWMKNLRTLGCSFYETTYNKAYVTVKMNRDYDKAKLILWENLSSKSKKYYGMNSYFSVYLNAYATEKKDKIFSFVVSDNSNITRENISKLPYIHDVNEEKVEILINSFKRDIQIFTRQLVLPYNDFTEKMAELSEYDDFEKLDYLCREYAYPREEIKKRMAEWKFIKEMEEKKKKVEEDVEPKRKSLMKRLFGF